MPGSRRRHRRFVRADRFDTGNVASGRDTIEDRDHPNDVRI
jgi:hypothetical protein